MVTGHTNDSNDPTMGVAQKVAVGGAGYTLGPSVKMIYILWQLEIT